MATARPRVLPLVGGVNLRDMGGYPVQGGGHVRYGTLYRSGVMHRLTAADEAHLAGLGIKVVCDLRRPNERKHYPSRWAATAGVPIWSRDYVTTSGQLAAMVEQNEDFTAEKMRDAMIALYRDILVDHADSFRGIFAHLLAGEVPMLFNCTAGKDRTGVTGALIFEAIGVDRATILEDYLLTNAADLAVLYRDMPESALARAAQTHPDALAAVLTADAAYLDTMFATLDARPDGAAGYLAELGVDEAARARLRALLVD